MDNINIKEKVTKMELKCQILGCTRVAIEVVANQPYCYFHHKEAMNNGGGMLQTRHQIGLKEIKPQEAKRSDRKPSYRLIYKGFLEDLAYTLEEGHEKYSEGEFDRNWQKGDQKFFRECLDHLIEHVMTYNETGDRYHNGEDHLAHAVANLMFLMWAEDFKKINWPHLEEDQWLNDDPRMTDTSDVSVGSDSYGLGAHDYLTGNQDEHEEELEREQIIELEQKIKEMESTLNVEEGWFKKFFKKG